MVANPELGGTWLLLIPIKRSQLRQLGHLFPLSPRHLPREVFPTCPTGRMPQDRPRICWRDYVSQLAWACLSILSEELEDASVEREVWESLLRLIPLYPR